MDFECPGLCLILLYFNSYERVSVISVRQGWTGLLDNVVAKLVPYIY